MIFKFLDEFLELQISRDATDTYELKTETIHRVN